MIQTGFFLSLILQAVLDQILVTSWTKVLMGFTFFWKILSVFLVVIFQNRAPASGATSRPKPGMSYLLVKYITWKNISLYWTSINSRAPVYWRCMNWESKAYSVDFFWSIMSWTVPDILHTLFLQSWKIGYAYSVYCSLLSFIWKKKWHFMLNNCMSSEFIVFEVLIQE